MQYSKPNAMVYLKEYMMDELDIWHYYKKSDGTTVTPYIDKNDGLYKSSVSGMVSYSSGVGCADVLLNVIPSYIADEPDTEKLNGLTEKGVYSVWCVGNTLKYNENNLKLTDLYDDGTLKITAEYAGK